MPDIYKQFVNIAKTLENHYRDMQDMEFTIEKGKLYLCYKQEMVREQLKLLLKIAVDLVKEGMITKEEAILKS